MVNYRPFIFVFFCAIFQRVDSIELYLNMGILRPFLNCEMRFFVLIILLIASALVNGASQSGSAVLEKSLPTKHSKGKLSEELEYPCQGHSCGCTRETCFSDCCCADMHESFDEKKTEKQVSVKEFAENSQALELPMFRPVSFLKNMICKQNATKKNEFLSPKKEISVRKENKEPLIISKAIFINCNYVMYFEHLKTQFYFLPEIPPPNFS